MVKLFSVRHLLNYLFIELNKIMRPFKRVHFLLSPGPTVDGVPNLIENRNMKKNASVGF
jgi:hypothetical protein